MIVRLKARRKKTDFKGKLEQILPTFCQYNKEGEWIQVQFYQLFATVLRWSLWRFEKKKLPNFSFDWQEGRKKKGLFCKEIATKWRNLKIWVISSQIPPTFCHGTKVKPWKFEKKIPNLSFVWRERKKEKSCFAKK